MTGNFTAFQTQIFAVVFPSAPTTVASLVLSLKRQRRSGLVLAGCFSICSSFIPNFCGLIGPVDAANEKKNVAASARVGGAANSGNSANKDEKGQKDELRDLWKHSVPVKAISANQLPVGKLVGHLRKHRVTEIRQILKESPVHAGDRDERNMWEAACLATENRPEQAIVLFDKVKNLNTAPVLVLCKAAESYASDAQYDRAIKLCNIVLSKYEMVDAYRIRAGCFSATNRPIEAAADFEKLAVLGGASPIRYYCRAGSLLLKAGKFKEALTIVDRGIKAVPGGGIAPLLMVKADCYKSQNRWQEAIDCATEAIRLTRSRGSIRSGEDEVILSTCYKERAAWYKKLGKVDLAQKDLKALEESSKGIADEIIGDR